MSPGAVVFFASGAIGAPDAASFGDLLTPLYLPSGGYVDVPVRWMLLTPLDSGSGMCLFDKRLHTLGLLGLFRKMGNSNLHYHTPSEFRVYGSCEKVDINFTIRNAKQAARQRNFV